MVLGVVCVRALRAVEAVCVVVVLGYLVGGVGGGVGNAGCFAEFASVEAMDGVEDEGGCGGEDYVSGLGALAAVLAIRFSRLLLRCHSRFWFSPWMPHFSMWLSRNVVVAPHRGFWGREERRSGMDNWARHWDWDWRLHNIPVILREGEADSRHICGNGMLRIVGRAVFEVSRLVYFVKKNGNRNGGFPIRL